MKQYYIISTPEGKMLRPINTHEKHLIDEFGLFRNPDHVTFEINSKDLPYIGTREPGTVVSEGEVRQIKQCFSKALGRWVGHRIANTEPRTVYTDAEPDDYPGIDYQPLFNHMSKQHGLTLTTSEMDEIIGLSTYILSKK